MTMKDIVYLIEGNGGINFTGSGTWTKPTGFTYGLVQKTGDMNGICGQGGGKASTETGI